jgi:PD-(D/E)XK endonuclease
MILNPTGKGKTTEAVILATLVKLGKSVSILWGEERYDLALDEGGRLMRIQCKTGHIRDWLRMLQDQHHGRAASTRRRRLRRTDRRICRLLPSGRARVPGLD